jgi:hypothetical protein
METDRFLRSLSLKDAQAILVYGKQRKICLILQILVRPLSQLRLSNLKPPLLIQHLLQLRLTKPQKQIQELLMLLLTRLMMTPPVSTMLRSLLPDGFTRPTH